MDPVVDARAARNARWYLGGLAASLLGNSALSLVAGIWIKALTGSSAQAGLVSVCVYAPTLLAPVAGLLADRLPRRAYLSVLNLAGAATTLALVAVHSRAQAWIVFAVMAAVGLGLTLVDPVESALFVEILTPRLRRRLNAWQLAIQESGRLVAPLLGAGLFLLVGGGAVAALDAATFLVAAIAVSRVRPLDTGADRPAVTTPGPPLRAEAGPRRPGARTAALMAGGRHIRDTPTIRPVAVAAMAAMALSGIGVAAQYSFVAALHERPPFLGVLSAILGGGSVLASLASGAMIARLGERRIAVIGIVDLAAGELLRCIPWLPTAILSSLVLGFALPLVFLAVLNVSQRATPDHLQGRVSAALTLGLFGPLAPAQALGSLLIAHVGYEAIYAGSAAVALGIAGWLAAVSARAQPGAPVGRARRF